MAGVEARVLLDHPSGIKIYNGGYGSAAAVVPGRDDALYLLVDRGPNVDTANEGEKAFLVPEFAPHIARFELSGTTLKRVATIELRDASGRPYSGLPNAAGPAARLERAVAPDGRPLQRHPNGFDPEGLAAMPDGSFWVADEYGPHLLHLDATGRELERVSPFEKNARGHSLPKVLARRRLNYGIEGLTATPDGRTLVIAMQSAVDNPDSGVRAATRTTRLVFIDLATWATRQFVYLRDRGDNSVTAITAVSAGEFLVAERDDGFATDPATPATYKRVYRVEVGGATDVHDAGDSEGGRLFGGKTLEQLTDGELAAAAITPVVKTLAVDLLRLPGGYPHDKPEGLAILGGRVLAVANDDDFGINDEQGRLVPKMIPGRGQLDRNEVYFIPLEAIR